jgi:hypothetical protein
MVQGLCSGIIPWDFARLAVLGLSLGVFASCGGGSASAPPPAVSVTVSVSPSAANLLVSGTQQFTATVGGTSNTAVTWTVNGILGGNSAVGTINSQGLYTAPSTVPTLATTIVTATSQADNSKSASGIISLSYPTPSVLSVTPSLVAATASGEKITVNGKNFVHGSTVELAGSVLTTSFVSGTEVTASVPGGNGVVAGIYPVTVANPTPGGGTSANSANLTVAPAIVNVQPSGGTVGSTISVVVLGGTPIIRRIIRLPFRRQAKCFPHQSRAVRREPATCS